jgi:hypothetical protein
MRLQLLPDINYKNHVDDLISICGKNNTNDKNSVNEKIHNLILLNQMYRPTTYLLSFKPESLSP